MLINHGAFVATDGFDSYDDDIGYALLPRAVKEGDHEVTRFLLEAGACIHGVDLRFITALQVAAERGDIEAAQLLIDAGADINVSAGNSNYLKKHMLQRCWELRTLIPIASLAGYSDMVQVLVNKGADVNAFRWEDGDNSKPWAEYRKYQWGGCGDFQYTESYFRISMTPLQTAVLAGDPASVLILLNSGSEINAAASHSWGRTALQAAAENGNLVLAKSLIDAGANVNADASPESGRTCL